MIDKSRATFWIRGVHKHRFSSLSDVQKNGTPEQLKTEVKRLNESGCNVTLEFILKHSVK